MTSKIHHYKSLAMSYKLNSKKQNQLSFWKEILSIQYIFCTAILILHFCSMSLQHLCSASLQHFCSMSLQHFCICFAVPSLQMVLMIRQQRQNSSFQECPPAFRLLYANWANSDNCLQACARTNTNDILTRTFYFKILICVFTVHSRLEYQW